jgi:hypothetical protein
VERRITASQDLQANRSATSPVLPIISELSHFSHSSSLFEKSKTMSSHNNPENVSGPSGSTSTGIGTSANRGTTTQHMVNQFTTRKMPKPGEKNAPSFDPEKPGELGRFFERMEDWFADEGILTDENKKKRIVRYLDADSEIQWKALSKFDNGSFAEFRAEVMESYPKAEEIMKGSVSGLKKKIRSIGPVAVDERDDLLQLIRVMTAEVVKLKKISPPIHTNRELVELFLSRLTGDFAGRVAHKLSMHRVVSSTNPAGNNLQARNPEDMYDIEEVMQMAKNTALEQANPFGKFLWSVNNGPGDSSSVKLEEAVARLTDSVNLQNQRAKQIDQQIASMHSYFNQSQARNASANSGNMETRQDSYRTQNAYPNMDKCFYCGGTGHMVRNCEHALKHLANSWIVRMDNQLRLPDGNRVPRDGVKTLKEVVEGLHQSRPGIIPMSKIPDKSSFFQDSPQMVETFVQSRPPDTEAEGMRLLAEVFRQVGADTMKKFLSHGTAQQESEREEMEETWEQNFD